MSFQTQIRIFLMKPKSFLTLHRQNKNMSSLQLSVEYTLQNLTRGCRSPRHFVSTFLWILSTQTYYYFYILFFCLLYTSMHIQIYYARFLINEHMMCFVKTNSCYTVFLLSTSLKPALYFLLQLVMMCLWIYVTTCAILIDRSIDFLDFTLVKSH